jgi:cobalt-zinc-cadmium efflux system membrane fusion protein
MKPEKTAVGICVALALVQCSRGENPASKPGAAPAVSAPSGVTAGSAHTDEPAHDSLPKRLRLDPQVIRDAKIETAPAVREVLAAVLDLPGEIAPDPDKTARVSALASGRLESVRFKEGEQVKKGDVLAVVKVPELGKIRSAFTAASSKAQAARANAERLRSLRPQGLSAEQEVLNAEAEAEALEAEARAASGQLSAMGMGARGASALLSLHAPITGVVVARDALVGQPVTPDQVIATIADLTEVWFLARVFEKNLGQIQPGAGAEIQLNAYPKEQFSGSIEYLGKQIDPTARTLVARIRLLNRGDLLRLGLFGVARVSASERQKDRAPTLVVPRSAVTEVGKKEVVFVRQPDGDFDLHEVILGEGALGKVQVLSGLREGEAVVVEGVFTLKSSVLRSTFGDSE